MDRNAAARALTSGVSAFGLLLMLCLGAYWNSLGNGFVGFDDSYLIERNLRLRPEAGSPFLTKPSKESSSKRRIILHRSLRLLTYALDYRLSGSDPFVYHLSNVLYHAAAAFMVFLMGRALLESPGAGLAAAALFALHPVQTESVAYLAGRRDILAGIFYAAGFHLFWLYRQRDRNAYLAAAVAVFLVGLTAKETLVTLPLLCLLYDLQRRPPAPWATRVAAAAVVPLLTVALIKLDWRPAQLLEYLRSSGLAGWLGGAPGPHAATAARIWLHAAKLLAYPGTLLADYSPDAFPASRSLWDPAGAAALALLLAAAEAARRFFRSNPVPVFLGLWTAVSFLPTGQILPYREVFAEHWLYIPSMGFCLLAGWLLQKLWRSGPRGRTLSGQIFLLACGLCAWRTIRRNGDWKDGVTLWSKTVAAAPRCARARHNLGYALQTAALERGDPALLDRAVDEYRRALALRPKAATWSNIGTTLRLRGLFAQAVAAQEAALALDPASPPAHYNLGLLYHFHLRDPVKAAQHYEKAIKFAPRLSEPRNNLGLILLQRGDVEKARVLFEAALERGPENTSALNNLGLIAVRDKDWAAAARHFHRAAALGSDPERLHFYMARLYEARGLARAARRERQRALLPR